MAVVTSSNVQVHGHTTPAGHMKASDGGQVVGCFVSVGRLSGTYAQADNAEIGDLAGIIESSRRDGRTVTLLQACMAAPGQEAGVTLGASGVTVGGDDLDFALTQADLSTERANGAMGSLEVALTFFVLYKLAP